MTPKPKKYRQEIRRLPAKDVDLISARKDTMRVGLSVRTEIKKILEDISWEVIDVSETWITFRRYVEVE